MNRGGAVLRRPQVKTGSSHIYEFGGSICEFTVAVIWLSGRWEMLVLG